MDPENDKIEAEAQRIRFEDQIKQKDSVIAQLREENANLRNQVSIATSGKGVPGPMAAMVQEKMRAGLSREDAIDVATRQLAHDTRLAEETLKTREGKAKAEAEAQAKADAEKAKAEAQAAADKKAEARAKAEADKAEAKAKADKEKGDGGKPKDS